MKQKNTAIIGTLLCLVVISSLSVSANEVLGNSNNVSIGTSKNKVSQQQETIGASKTTNEVFIDNVSKQLFGEFEVSNDNLQLTKDDVYSKIINSIDYYTQVSGSTITITQGLDNPTYTEFNSDLITGTFKEKIYNINGSIDVNNFSFDTSNIEPDNINCGSYNENIVSDNSEIKSVEIDNVNDTILYVNGGVTTKALSTCSEGIRTYTDENGDKNYVYRGNATNINSSELNLFSQYLAFGYLEDFNNWDIIGTDEYLGRYCTIIQGGYTEYGTKFNVDNFKMYVDSNTGVVLRYEGYSNDTLVDYAIVTDISYTSDIDINEISALIENYASQYEKISIN